MKKLTLLGNVTSAEFLRRHWHKKPLLIRQAFSHFKPILAANDLFKLASNEDVESRLVTQINKTWALEHGPFHAKANPLPDIKQKKWTLLVQGVDLHLQAANDLLRQFNFLPEARLDDLMISYASDGGGVGPHFDSYDVFLLQAWGKRRWRISAQQDLELVENAPLKILRHFKPEQEFILEPGDMLYLPPHYAHEGVAVGECMTYSIGFRSPTFQELGESFLQYMADTIALPGRYADADLKPSKHPAELSKIMLEKITRALKKLTFTQDDMTLFIGDYLSAPKPTVYFNKPEKGLSHAQFLKAAKRYGIQLALKSRMLYRGKHVFINGESLHVGGADKRLLMCLANTRTLSGEQIAAASLDMQQTLSMWNQDGWIHIPQY